MTLDYLLIIAMISIWIIHFFDMFYTVKLIEEARKKIENPELLELNYHRYFIQKFGMKKGVRYSFIISSLLFVLAVYYMYIISKTFFGLGIIFGMTILMTTLNIRSYYYTKEHDRKIKYKKEFLLKKLEETD